MTNLLFICSGAIDRSPCAASLFDDSKYYSAKYAGIGPLTENPVTKELIEWSDKIFVMEFEHKVMLFEQFSEAREKEIDVLGISNDYLRFDLKLEKILKKKLNKFI